MTFDLHGDATHPDGAWLVITEDGTHDAVACIHVDPRGINDPVAVAGFRANPGTWPEPARLYPAVTGVIVDYEARRAMAAVLHLADKGTGFDASPSYVRDRYMLLAAAALKHAASAAGSVALAPVAAGWRDGVIAVNADADDLDPPRGFDRLYRVTACPGTPLRRTRRPDV